MAFGLRLLPFALPHGGFSSPKRGPTWSCLIFRLPPGGAACPALGEGSGLGMDLSPTENSHLHPSCEVTKARAVPMAGLWGQSSLPAPACCPPSSPATGMGRGPLLGPQDLGQAGHRDCDILDPHEAATRAPPSGASLLVCSWVPTRLGFSLRHPGCAAQLCHRFPHTKAKQTTSPCIL